MTYKDKKEQMLYYYKNRDEKIKYQREYDKSHKDRKRAYDIKRKAIKNKQRVIQAYSQKHFFPIFLKMFKGCQICGEINRLQIHHFKYTKEIKDCCLLCKNCHKLIHLKNHTGITQPIIN